MGESREEGNTPGAKFFGKDNPFELQILQNKSLSASTAQLGQAAQYLEVIFGNKHAWCGGWALKLRGSKRNTEDLDIIVQAPSTADIWDTLVPYNRVTLFYHRHVFEEGGSHFKIFVNADDGQLVCVDVLVAGGLTTPKLDAEGVVDEIEPVIPIAGTGVKRVVSLRWQVRQKLAAGATRRKLSDYADLQWLCDQYANEIKVWIKEEDEAQRRKFYEWVLDNELDDGLIEATKESMGLYIGTYIPRKAQYGMPNLDLERALHFALQLLTSATKNPPSSACSRLLLY
ncbi:hypothetical protein TOPH_02801 [Tolypocladium ophioglossoides CBS 100239]|uniref:Uncharacterized protein n=1 Tax=Tolypocladium ophioglossoides (strain CBS 100239) TaxID=1163406 RepID=A0A0L0NFI9_TOLOC|nr:hypothetical protein TOPH_02801 [Tolypocladium ophioglossoides CBS 100239]